MLKNNTINANENDKNHNKNDINQDNANYSSNANNNKNGANENKVTQANESGISKNNANESSVGEIKSNMNSSNNDIKLNKNSDEYARNLQLIRDLEKSLQQQVEMIQKELNGVVKENKGYIVMSILQSELTLKLEETCKNDKKGFEEMNEDVEILENYVNDLLSQKINLNNNECVDSVELSPNLDQSYNQQPNLNNTGIETGQNLIDTNSHQKQTTSFGQNPQNLFNNNNQKSLKNKRCNNDLDMQTALNLDEKLPLCKKRILDNRYNLATEKQLTKQLNPLFLNANNLSDLSKFHIFEKKPNENNNEPNENNNKNNYAQS